jgi:adenosylcobinamide kinase/adenosylcobinamide-phosphate guanylyltransferase
MGRMILITGGGRSGKSSYAQRLAETLPGPRAYLATAIPFDGELAERIARHKDSRRDQDWAATIEEPLELARALRDAEGFATVLVDCLTVWVGNLMWAAEDCEEPPWPAEGAETAVPSSGRAETVTPVLSAADGALPPPSEEEITLRCRDVAAAAREHPGTVLFVTNEVGLGVIPENRAARLYRDLLGRCNQLMAGEADEVVLMVSGLPLVVKAASSA